MSRAIAVVGHGARFARRFGPALAAAGLQVEAIAGIESLRSVQSSTDITAIVISALDGAVNLPSAEGQVESLFQLLDRRDLERTVLISDQLPAAAVTPRVVLPEDVSAEAFLFHISGMVPPDFQRRQDERFLVTIPVKYRTSSTLPSERTGAMTESTLSNLSLGGAFVRSLSPPPVGSRVYLELEMTEAYPPLALHGRVVYKVIADLERGIVFNPADPDRQLTAHPGFAVVFDGSSFEARSLLQRLLRDLARG